MLVIYGTRTASRLRAQPALQGLQEVHACPSASASGVHTHFRPSWHGGGSSSCCEKSAAELQWLCAANAELRRVLDRLEGVRGPAPTATERVALEQRMRVLAASIEQVLASPDDSEGSACGEAGPLSRAS